MNQMKHMVAGIEQEILYTREAIGRSAFDERVMEAVKKVPRHKFVPPDLHAAAYDDRPLPIGEGQTISQPYMVALMTDLLALDENAVVLEVGTGSGYQTAILHELAGEIYSIEITEPLVRMKIKRATCIRGEVAKLVCELQHITPFEGEATAELLGLPPNVTTAPAKFTKETKELVFDLQTNEKTPYGKHRSLFVRVTITQHNEPIVSTAGRSELLVMKPKPPKADPADPKKKLATPKK